MKKILLILIIFISTGCTNFNELNDLAITAGLYINKNNNQYEVGVEILKGEKGKDEMVEDKMIIKDTCNIIDECFNKISNKISKTIYLPHTQVIIIDNNIGNDKKELQNALDYIYREIDLRTNCVIAIYEGDTYKLFSNKDYLEKIASTQIYKTLNSHNAKSYSLDLFVINSLIKSSSSFIPVIKENNNQIIIDSLNIYKDFKYIKNINEDKNEYLLLTNNIYSMNIVLECAENKYITMDAYNVSSNKKILDKHNIDINVSIKAKIDTYECSNDLKNINTFNDLNEYVKNKYKEVLENKINNIGKDNINIDKLLYQKGYNPNGDYNYKINVKFDIAKKGMINNGFTTEGKFK